MNLSELRAFCGNILDWDPDNSQYKADLNKFLNEAQTRLLSDAPWSFRMFDVPCQAWTDSTFEIGVANGSATITTSGTFPLSTSAALPGSPLDGAVAHFTDSSDVEHEIPIAWVSATNTAYFTRDYLGVTGTYTATFRQRKLYLPADTLKVNTVADLSQGTIPRPQAVLTRFAEVRYGVDRTQLGTPVAYVPYSGVRTNPPRAVNGVSTTVGVSQGVRTINVYMCNVLTPTQPDASSYPQGVSGGRESALSAVETYSLTALQTLSFTPETIPNVSGLYRRYYFTCPEAGIYAPVRVVSAGGTPAAGRDTVSPAGGVTLSPDLSLSYLQSQTAQERLIRYVPTTGTYQSIELYPHPSSDRIMQANILRAAPRMVEDTDTPAVPDGYESLIAFMALELLAMKVGNEPLAQLYKRKADILHGRMAAQYMDRPSQVIQRGMNALGSSRAYQIWGPIRFLGNVR